jgi:N-acetylmuramoyl-L-alanine amidase
MLSILAPVGTVTRTVANLNAFLKAHKCPEYADLYRKAGEEFGVRWDVAIFQSILETGWFWNNSGPFDVKKEQNNFAGLGATGGGVPGDSFPDPLTGIRAQLQDLALRCDTYLPRESIISPYAKKQYDTISNRHSKTWEDLSGTWAADKSYHVQIYRIMDQFDKEFPASGDTPKPPPPTAATWIGISNNMGTCVQALADDKPVEIVEGKNVDALIALLQRHRLTARTFDVCARFSGTPDPVKPPSKKKTTIFLDPGHSKSRPGARSNDGKVKEELLNQHACEVLKSALESAGYSVTMWDPDPDNLTAVGAEARKYDVAISWHHNSYDGSGNPYHCVMIDPAAPNAWKLIASRLAIAMEKGARGTCADTVVFGGTNGLAGVYEAELTVLNTSANDPDGKKPFHILPEGYFLNKMTSVQACMDATKAIALEFSKQLMVEFPE